MNKRHPLMINRTDPPLAKGVCDPKGRRWEPILGLASLKAEWERRKELSDTVRAGATAHCVQIVTAARNFPITSPKQLARAVFSRLPIGCQS